LEAARILSAAGIKPRRTIRFILWGGEEQGLLGSKQYVVQHRSEMDKVSMVLNHDNGTNWARATSVTADMEPLLAPVVAAINSMPKPNPSAPDPFFAFSVQEFMRPAGGGSDHASFSPAGVPAVGWSLTGERPYGYGWHSQWDTYDIVVPEYQRHNATTFALVAYQVSKLDSVLPRDNVLRPGDPRLETAGGGRGGRGAGGGRRGARGQVGPLVAGRLGGELDNMTFTAINDAGYAKAANLKVGDVIVEVDGKPVTTLVEVNQELRDGQGTTLTLKVRLGTEVVTVTAPRPAGARRRRGGV
jgi:hypothetical protein